MRDPRGRISTQKMVGIWNKLSKTGTITTVKHLAKHFPGKQMRDMGQIQEH